MSQISPPIRILLVAVIGLCAAYFLFLRPKEETVAVAPPAATTPVPAKDPNATTNSKPGAAVQTAVKGADSASARADQAAGGAITESETGAAAGSTTTTPTGTGVNTNPAAKAPATGQTAAPTDVTKRVAQDAAEGRAQGGQGPQGARDALLQQPLRRRQGGPPRAPPRQPLRQAGLRRRALDQVRRPSYQAITRGANVDQSPTIVVADANLKAETLVGYVDRETIDQAVVDAIRASGGSLIKNPYFRKLDAICASARAADQGALAPATAAALPAFLTVSQASRRTRRRSTPRSSPPKKCAQVQRRIPQATTSRNRDPGHAWARRPSAKTEGSRHAEEPSASAASSSTRGSSRRTARTASAASRHRAYTRRVSAEGFTEHLQFPQGKGYRARRRVQRSRRRRRLRRSRLHLAARVRRPRGGGGLRGLGLRRRDRRRVGGGRAGGGRFGCSTRRASGRRRSRPSSAGCRPASCTRPSWPPTRCTAPWARRRGRGRRSPCVAGADARRDERRRRLRGRGAAHRRRAGGGHARAVGRRGQRRRGLVLLGARGAGRALARARDGDAALHARPAGGVPRRRGRAVDGGPRGGGDPEPVRAAATATCGSTRCSSSPTRWGRRRSPPVTTRA